MPTHCKESVALPKTTAASKYLLLKAPSMGITIHRDRETLDPTDLADWMGRARTLQMKLPLMKH